MFRAHVFFFLRANARCGGAVSETEKNEENVYNSRAVSRGDLKKTTHEQIISKLLFIEKNQESMNIRNSALQAENRCVIPRGDGLLVLLLRISVSTGRGLDAHLSGVCPGLKKNVLYFEPARLHAHPESSSSSQGWCLHNLAFYDTIWKKSTCICNRPHNGMVQ